MGNAHLYINNDFWTTMPGRGGPPTVNYIWANPTPVASVIPSPNAIAAPLPTPQLFTLTFAYVREDSPDEFIYELERIIG